MLESEEREMRLDIKMIKNFMKEIVDLLKEIKENKK